MTNRPRSRTTDRSRAGSSDRSRAGSTDHPADPRPAITAVIPVHNASATIARALESVKAQTLPVSHVIIVDDASSDDSLDIARAAGIEDLEIVRLEQNAGPGAARNAGVTRASTEWVATLDADDAWKPTFLEEVSGAIARFSADFGSCGGLRVKAYHGKNDVSRRLLKRPAGAYDLTDDFWRVALRFIPIHSSSTVVRRSLFLAVGGCPEDVRNGEDVALFMRLWLNGRFAFVNEPLFESVAIPSGLSAGSLTYHDVRVGLGRMVAAVLTAIRRRRRGSGWFALWVAGRFVRRHQSWTVRRLGIGRWLARRRSGPSGSRPSPAQAGEGGKDGPA